MSTFQNIRRIRKSRKITLRELSLATGIDAGTLSRIERGQHGTKVSQLLAIARALDVRPAELIEEGER